MLEIEKNELDMSKFMEKFNDIVYFAVDESKNFTIDDFYESCKDGTLIEKLEDLGFNLPEMEVNKQKYLKLICNEFDETKQFENGWFALMYYTWQGVFSYIGENFIGKI